METEYWDQLTTHRSVSCGNKMFLIFGTTVVVFLFTSLLWYWKINLLLLYNKVYTNCLFQYWSLSVWARVGILLVILSHWSLSYLNCVELSLSKMHTSFEIRTGNGSTGKGGSDAVSLLSYRPSSSRSNRFAWIFSSICVVISVLEQRCLCAQMIIPRNDTWCSNFWVKDFLLFDLKNGVPRFWFHHILNLVSFLITAALLF